MRDSLNEFTVRYEDQWPPASTRYTPLFLDGAQGSLSAQMSDSETTAGYNARNGQAAFRKTFEEETELTGKVLRNATCPVCAS